MPGVRLLVTRAGKIQPACAPFRSLLPPQQFSHSQWKRRVRHDLAGAHKDAEGSKQTDVSDEGGGFEHSKGIWVTPWDKYVTDRLTSVMMVITGLRSSWPVYESTFRPLSFPFPRIINFFLYQTRFHFIQILQMYTKILFNKIDVCIFANIFKYNRHKALDTTTFNVQSLTENIFSDLKWLNGSSGPGTASQCCSESRFWWTAEQLMGCGASVRGENKYYDGKAEVCRNAD